MFRKTRAQIGSVRPRGPSPAMLVAMVALFVALGGSAYAALNLPKDSIGARQLKNGSVTGAKISDNAVTSPKVKDHSLLARDFALGQLPAARGASTGVLVQQSSAAKAVGATANNVIALTFPHGYSKDALVIAKVDVSALFPQPGGGSTDVRCSLTGGVGGIDESDSVRVSQTSPWTTMTFMKALLAPAYGQATIRVRCATSTPGGNAHVKADMAIVQLDKLVLEYR